MNRSRMPVPTAGRSFLVMSGAAVMLASGFSVQPVFRPALNHAFLVLDSVTFEAVRESEFLRNELAWTFHPNDSLESERSRNTLSVMGRNTYLELFGPGSAMGGMQPGFTGIAYGFDEAGGLEWAQRQWEEGLGVPVVVQTQPFVRSDGSEGVAFSMAQIRGRILAGLTTWVMEYDPAYLRDRLGDTATVSFLSRARFNARWFRPDRPLEDIVGLTVVLSPERADTWVQEMAAIGFSLTDEGEAHVAGGEAIQIRVMTGGQARRGLVEIRFRLNRTLAPQRHVLGRSLLQVDSDGFATWSFGDEAG